MLNPGINSYRVITNADTHYIIFGIN